MTNPALLLYREEVPVERNDRHNYLQILSHLQSYKEDAFTKVENWQVFAKKLGKVLEIVSLIQIYSNFLCSKHLLQLTTNLSFIIFSFNS